LLILKSKLKFPKTIVHYISRKNVIDIYNLISQNLNEKDKAIFKKLYPNNNVNYGNVFNRIFIFAALFGAETIHRRDSDVLPDNDANGKSIFPIEIEAANLAHKHNGKNTYVVGGGYKGKYNLDIDDLVDDGDYTLVKELFDCMSIPSEHHELIIKDEILNNNLPFTYDKIEHNSGSYPDCGNVGIYKLNQYLPSSPQDFVLGSDYFFIDIAVHTKLDLVYHNRSLIHKHTKDRAKNPTEFLITGKD
jgi:hypothetical protein